MRLFVIRYGIISVSLTADLWEVDLARDRLGCQPDNTGVPSVPFAEVSDHRWKRAPTTDSWLGGFCLNREAQNVPVTIKSTLDDE
tara:strand:- start:75 stop:329 length:255 start_codon:yes stop_codon:yes gene_type:complete